jgi:hypothetical protein
MMLAVISEAGATVWPDVGGAMFEGDDASASQVGAPPAPVGSVAPSGEQEADLKACGCGWAKEIKYRAPAEIPVPDSVVAGWRKLPLTDERVMNAWKAAYQRREWKAYLRGLSPCARAGRGVSGDR